MPAEDEQVVRIGLIGGTGLGEALLDGLAPGSVERHEIMTPFGSPSGPIITAVHEGVEIAIVQRHGAGHVFNPTMVPYRANIFALKTLGCTHVLASGATGSLQEHIQPGDLCICDQIIDKTFRRPNTYYEQAAVHVEFADPFCDVMRRWLLAAAESLTGVTVHEKATYVCMEGPAFSTRAESHMHRQWGGDLIGMTAMPEAKLCREAEMAYALIALPTDYDCWRPRPRRGDSEPDSLIAEIIGNLNMATAASIALIRAALGDVGLLERERSAAHDALSAGIWTEKSLIGASEIERLRPIWGRHFG